MAAQTFRVSLREGATVDTRLEGRAGTHLLFVAVAYTGLLIWSMAFLQPCYEASGAVLLVREQSSESGDQR